MITEIQPKAIHDPRPWSVAYLHRAGPWLAEALCALRGHDLMLHFEQGKRICLRCADCGHETPGWDLS